MNQCYFHSASSLLLRQHSSIRIGLSSSPCLRADSSCHSMLMEQPMPAMPPGRGRMVCKASLRRTLQDVTEAVKGAATLRQRRWTQHPPCHSTPQHCPDSSPPRDKALAADSGQALLGSVHGRRAEAPHAGDSPPMAVSGSMHGNRAPAPTELGVGTGTSSPCFDIFPVHDLKDHCPRAESDGDVLRKATANMCCSFCLKYKYQEFFVWSHCLAKELHSC